MPNLPDGFEAYRITEPERCDLCRRPDDEMLLFDGFDPEDPGTGVLVCSECQSWGYRTLLFAENDSGGQG